jgi:hypothetical protein
MEVKIGVGYGEIFFGTSIDEVISKIGHPSKIVSSNRNGVQFLYNDLKVKLFFDADENNRLYSIEVFDKSVILFSKRIIGMSCCEFTEHMRSNNYNTFEKEDYDFFETLYFNDCNLTATTEFDVVTSLEFSPLFSNNNNDVLWPT